jgi:uncharacterized protein (DUF433 family)
LRGKINRIVLDSKILGGKPVIKGTRIASGMTEENLLQEYPNLRGGDIRAALEYASRILREEEVIPMEAQ